MRRTSGFFPFAGWHLLSPNRAFDGGASYAHAHDVLWLNTLSSYSAWFLGLAQIPFIINFFWSLRSGEAVDRNPWHSTTVEWQAPSPPPHGNFDHAPVIYRGPYDYSAPGHAEDFVPQTQEA